MRIIKQGAEAILYKNNNELIKERIKKDYRLRQIDEKLRRTRTRSEAKLLEKARVINVPRIIKVDEKNNKIIMEFINGELLKDILDKLNKKILIKICREIGRNIALLHDNDIVHGDLTTSNMILRDEKVYFIDFGLGFISRKVEDKAVDLHLMKQALESKHYKIFYVAYKSVIDGYKKSKDFKEVIKRLENVESRGRYKREIRKNL